MAREEWAQAHLFLLGGWEGREAEMQFLISRKLFISNLCNPFERGFCIFQGIYKLDYVAFLF